jgi:hypothetical protein
VGQWTKKVHNSKQSFMWVAKHVRIQVNTKLSAFSSPFLTTQYPTIQKQEKAIKTFTTQAPISGFFSFFLVLKFWWNVTKHYHPLYASEPQFIIHSMDIIYHTNQPF